MVGEVEILRSLADISNACREGDAFLFCCGKYLADPLGKYILCISVKDKEEPALCVKAAYIPLSSDTFADVIKKKAQFLLGENGCRFEEGGNIRLVAGQQAVSQLVVLLVDILHAEVTIDQVIIVSLQDKTLIFILKAFHMAVQSVLLLDLPAQFIQSRAEVLVIDRL